MHVIDPNGQGCAWISEGDFAIFVAPRRDGFVSRMLRRVAGAWIPHFPENQLGASLKCDARPYLFRCHRNFPENQLGASLKFGCPLA